MEALFFKYFCCFVDMHLFRDSSSIKAAISSTLTLRFLPASFPCSNTCRILVYRKVQWDWREFSFPEAMSAGYLNNLASVLAPVLFFPLCIVWNFNTLRKLYITSRSCALEKATLKLYIVINLKRLPFNLDVLSFAVKVNILQ